MIVAGAQGGLQQFGTYSRGRAHPPAKNRSAEPLALPSPLAEYDQCTRSYPHRRCVPESVIIIAPFKRTQLSSMTSALDHIPIVGASLNRLSSFPHSNEPLSAHEPLLMIVAGSDETLKAEAPQHEVAAEQGHGGEDEDGGDGTEENSAYMKQRPRRQRKQSSSSALYLSSSGTLLPRSSGYLWLPQPLERRDPRVFSADRKTSSAASVSSTGSISPPPPAGRRRWAGGSSALARRSIAGR